MVGVLIFIDEKVFKTGAVFIADGFIFPKQQDGIDKKVVEIHTVESPQAILVKAINFRRAGFKIPRRSFGKFLRTNQLIFRIGYLFLLCPGRKLILQKPELFDAVLDQRQRIDIIKNGKMRIKTKMLRFATQQLGTERMKGGNIHIGYRAAHERLDPAFHFPGGFIGESHGQYLVRARQPLLQKVR